MTCFRKLTFFAAASIRVTERSERTIFSGMPGKPPPEPDEVRVPGGFDHLDRIGDGGQVGSAVPEQKLPGVERKGFQVRGGGVDVQGRRRPSNFFLPVR